HRRAVPGDLSNISEYTPFGYLRNPGHRARSWADVEGGNLRSTIDHLGIEWVYPLQRDPTSRRGIGLATSSCRTPADFEAIGLTSRHHSANMLGFDWTFEQIAVAARFFLVDPDTLAARVQLTNLSTESHAADLQVFQIAEGNVPGEHVLVIGD